MSHWEYEAGRKICLENMARGDFSNGGVTQKELAEPGATEKWIQWAKNELKELEKR